MSRKYLKNDFKKRCVFSHWRNVDNNSADITSAQYRLSVKERNTNKIKVTKKYRYHLYLWGYDDK